MQSNNIIHFPGLNGIRIIAASIVIFTHLERMKMYANVNNYSEWIFFKNAGPIGVELFFVLSGFLISYLLFVEKKETQDVSLKKFYFRRILRIWPLYYFIFFVGFFLLPYLVYIEKLSLIHFDNSIPYIILNLLLFPNIAFAGFGTKLFVVPLWSVGIEEQFYLTWAPFVKKFFKYVLHFLIAFIFIWVALRYFTTYMDTKGYVWHKIFLIFSTMKFECMAIGCLGAWIFFQGKNEILKVFYHPLMQIVSILLFFVFLFTENYLGSSQYLIHSFFFLMIIMNVSTNPNSILKLNHSILNYLGKISYGVYMYHLIIITLLVQFFPKNLGTDFLCNFIYYALTLILTIFISAISYRYFEKPFLTIKEKYMIIKSKS